MNLVLALCVGANIIAGVGIIIYAVKNWFAKPISTTPNYTTSNYTTSNYTTSNYTTLQRSAGTPTSTSSVGLYVSPNITSTTSDGMDDIADEDRVY